MRNWLNSNWLELLISVLVAIMEAAMIAPWLMLLASASGREGLHPAIFVGAAVVGSISFWSARELLTREWDVAAMRMASLGIWLAALMIWYGIVSGNLLTGPFRFIDGLFSFEPLAFGMLTLGGLALWRGLWLGSTGEAFSSEFIRTGVLFAVLSYALVLVIAGFGADAFGAPVISVAVVAVPIGVAAALIAATAIQVRESRIYVKETGSQRSPGNRWLGAGTAIAAGILLLAAILAGTVDRRIWEIVFWPGIQFLRGIEFALNWVVLGLAYVVFLFLSPLFWLVQRFVTPPDESPFDENGFAGPIEQQQPAEAGDLIPEPILQLLQWSVVLIIIALVVWFALRQLQRYQALRGAGDEDEIRESLWSSEAVMDDLGAMLRGLRPRWGRRASVDLSQQPEDVREAYLYSLVHAHRQGLGRDPRESPSHFADRLSSSAPDAAEPFNDLTERYLRARYAERFTDEDVRISREDWQAIRQRMRGRSAPD